MNNEPQPPNHLTSRSLDIEDICGDRGSAPQTAPYGVVSPASGWGSRIGRKTRNNPSLRGVMVNIKGRNAGWKPRLA